MAQSGHTGHRESVGGPGALNFEMTSIPRGRGGGAACGWPEAWARVWPPTLLPMAAELLPHKIKIIIHEDRMVQNMEILLEFDPL